MNKAEVVAFFRTCADISDQMCATRGKHPELYRALALAIQQGGGCPMCHGQGALMRTTWNIQCETCHGTGTSPELAKLLAQLGVKA